MIPAQPPFPTASNFPFQFSAGSQTSISICESDDGLSVAAVRQNAGTLSGAAAFPPTGSTGARNSPAGTSSAMVMVVSGNESDLSPPQGVAARPAVTRSKATLAIIFKTSGSGQNSHRFGINGCLGTFHHSFEPPRSQERREDRRHDH